MTSFSKDTDFYITLPSNTYDKVFNTNKTSSYSTKLCQPINLTNGNWIVALVELHMPWSFYNINSPNEQIIIQTIKNNKLSRHVINVLPGYYPNISSILQLLPKQHSQLLKYNERRNHISISHLINKNDQYMIGMTPELQNILGFTNNRHIDKKTIYLQTKYESDKSQVISSLANLKCNIDYNIPSEINVSADIIKHSSILRKINISKFEYGRMHTFTFPQAHYIKVEKNFFDTIHINLKDEHGKYLPFEFGTSNLTLHFKRK